MNNTFDYKTIVVEQKNLYQQIDYMESLGWNLVDKRDHHYNSSITFKRDKSIKNREALNRLSLRIEDYQNMVIALETKKKHRAIITSSIIGGIAALIFGLAMCLCMPDVLAETVTLWMYICGGICAIIGIILGGINFKIYKRVLQKDAVKISSLIDIKREEIASLLDKASELLK